MTRAGDPRLSIRPAEARDADFLAWAILAATRSHLGRGWFDIALDRPESACLTFLRRLTVASPRSWWHHSRFYVADVGGAAAAALCAFKGSAPYSLSAPAIAEVSENLGWEPFEPERIWQRGAYLFTCTFEGSEEHWSIECIATLPERRGSGLATALIEHATEAGRLEGCHVAQITVVIGNEPAERAYRRAGFSIAGEARSPQFEAATGAPGLRRYLRSL